MGLNVKYKLLQNLCAADIGHKYILEQGSTKIGLYIYGLEISNLYFGLEISNLYPWA